MKLPNCTPLIGYWGRTEPSGGASGQASDIAIHAKEILRVREVLTKIYQRHCAKEGEAVEDGVARFGKFVLFIYLIFLSCSSSDTSELLIIVLNPFIEKALERDYFLTGEFQSLQLLCIALFPGKGCMSKQGMQP